MKPKPGDERYFNGVKYTILYAWGATGEQFLNLWMACETDRLLLEQDLKEVCNG